MTWLLYVISCFLIVFFVISGVLVYYYYSRIKLSEIAGPNIPHTPWKNEVLTTESEERSQERLPTKEENKRSAEIGYSSRRQHKSRESEEYWASDESGERSSNRKSPVKKPRGKKGSQTRFGVSESSDSSAGDNQSLEKPPSFPQESEQRLAFLNSGTERDSNESALRGKPVNYSGNGSDRSSDSETLVPMEDHTLHDPHMPRKFTHQNPFESPYVSQLKEEIDALKKEITSKNKRSANVLNRIVGEKDKEISELKKMVKELKKELDLEKDRSEQVELLRLQLQSAIKQYEDSLPAEEVPIGGDDTDDQLHSHDGPHRDLAQV